MPDVSNSLESLERRVERLTSWVIIQCVLLAAVVLMDVMQLAPYVALLLLIAVPVLVFYRRQLPPAARWIGRTVQRWRGEAGAVAGQNEEQAT